MGEVVKDITAALRSYKSENGISLNASMPKVQVVSDRDISSMLMDIMKTTKAKNVVQCEEKDLEEVISALKPVKSKIGPEFKAKAGKVMQALAKQDPAVLASALAKGNARLKLDGGEEVTLGPEHVQIVKGWAIKGKDVDLLKVEGATVLIDKE